MREAKGQLLALGNCLGLGQTSMRSGVTLSLGCQGPASPAHLCLWSSSVPGTQGPSPSCGHVVAIVMNCPEGSTTR